MADAAPMERTRFPGVYKRGKRYVAVYLVDGKQRRESAATLKEAKAIKAKIHETFRLQYLKDAVFARMMDDPTNSVLASLIFINHVEICKHFTQDENFLDELRLYPKDAQMITTAYDPKVGKTAECDENNRITYYEYDGLGRLVYVKDEQNVKKYGISERWYDVFITILGDSLTPPPH